MESSLQVILSNRWLLLFVPKAAKIPFSLLLGNALMWNGGRDGAIAVYKHALVMDTQKTSTNVHGYLTHWQTAKATTCAWNRRVIAED